MLNDIQKHNVYVPSLCVGPSLKDFSVPKNIFVFVNPMKIFSLITDLFNKLGNIYYQIYISISMGAIRPFPCIGPTLNGHKYGIY